MTTIWASEHSRLYGHRTTDTDCEDCGARLPMHVAGEGENVPEPAEVALSGSNRRSLDPRTDQKVSGRQKGAQR